MYPMRIFLLILGSMFTCLFYSCSDSDQSKEYTRPISTILKLHQDRYAEYSYDLYVFPSLLYLYQFHDSDISSQLINIQSQYFHNSEVFSVHDSLIAESYRILAYRIPLPKDSINYRNEEDNYEGYQFECTRVLVFNKENGKITFISEKVWDQSAFMYKLSTLVDFGINNKIRVPKAHNSKQELIRFEKQKVFRFLSFERIFNRENKIIYTDINLDGIRDFQIYSSHDRGGRWDTYISILGTYYRVIESQQYPLNVNPNSKLIYNFTQDQSGMTLTLYNSKFLASSVYMLLEHKQYELSDNNFQYKEHYIPPSIELDDNSFSYFPDSEYDKF